MDRYIGLDIHAQTTTLAVMSAKGRHLTEKVIETNGKLLVETIGSIAGDLHVCLEEGMHAEWIHELLARRVARIVVMIPPEHHGPKSDARDAWWLADQLRLGVPQKQVFKSKLSGLREAVRAHQAFTKHSTRAKLQLRFLARGRGLSVDRAQLLDEQERRALIAQLPAERRLRAQLHGELVDHTEKLRQQALELLEQQVQRCPDVRRLLDVPGLGVVRAAQSSPPSSRHTASERESSSGPTAAWRSSRARRPIGFRKADGWCAPTALCPAGLHPATGP